jgi:hypothetical protein
VIGEGGTTSGVAVVTNEHTRMKDQFWTKLAQTVMTITDELPMILIANGVTDPTGSATPYSINSHQS